MEDEKTTITISRSIVAKIERLKVHERQPYEEVIELLVDAALLKREG